MWIEIEALDTLFFKDGKPFSMGEETWADGIFPPPPSVIYGAIRSAYMSQINQSVSLANESGDKSKNLNINNYCLIIDNTPYFPIPLDLVLKKQRSFTNKSKEIEKNEYQVHRLKLKKNKYPSSIHKLSFILSTEEEVEVLEESYINRIELEYYLDGEKDAFIAKNIDQIVMIEPKVGIGRNDLTRTSQDAKLYHVGMRRLNNIKIAVQIDNLDGLKKEGILKLGGEAKVAKYQSVDLKEVEQPDRIQKFFKLYLATPALLKNGWLPEWIEEKTFIGFFPNTNVMVKLIAVAIGRPIPIGGFDMKKKKPKPMLHAVSAGSVYYFEILEHPPRKEVEKIKPIRLCEFPERINEGFGISFVGAIK